MSVKVSGWVWEHAPVKSGELVVLLKLADCAHDDGSGAYPSQAELAEKSRMSERQVRNCLTALEGLGLIERSGVTRSGVVVWRVMMRSEVGGEDTSGGKSTAGDPGSPLPTEPSPNRHMGRERARTRPGLKVSGKPVKLEVWAATERTLAEYNRQAGSKLRLLTSAGHPSEAAKRIYLRLVNYPDITDAELADIIHRTLASRWWGDGPPSPGVVFGPRVFEDNITRPGNGNGGGISPERAAELEAAFFSDD